MTRQLFAAAAIVALAACIGDPERQRQRDAIKLCWDDQGKKSHAPDIARFVAGACEKLEADFQRRYGVKP